MTDFASRRRVMVDTQVRPSDVTEFPIIDAMLTVPREAFVPRERIDAAYADDHVSLSRNRVLLDPRSFAKMLDALNLTNADLVLDIGCGLGYSAAVIARIAEAVVALEEDPDMAGEAGTLLSEHDADNVILVEGPLVQGVGAHGPYDAIIIEGGVEELPAALTDQLKDGGRIVCLFMQGQLGTVRVGYKTDGMVSWRFAFNGAAPVLDGFGKTATFAL
jgi:protein-L-isoaspartate(D-aspartate) O-methyltransferase